MKPTPRNKPIDEYGRSAENSHSSNEDMATANKYTLRLLASLKSEAEKVAATEGTPLDQFINVAVVVKNERLKA